MTTFDDRKKGYENKYAHDAETEFKVTARRDRLFGEWIGEKLGKSGDDLAAYAKDVVVSDLEEAGDADILRKVKADLGAASIAVSDDDLQTALTGFYDVAAKAVAGK